MEIGAALGRLSRGPRGGGDRRGVALTTLAVAEAKPKRQRKPITDPERCRAALAKARAARAEKLAAARAAGDGYSVDEQAERFPLGGMGCPKFDQPTARWSRPANR